MLAESILQGLNPEQRRAVETTEGALLIVAGAGRGKTRVLVHRLAYLIGACGIPAEGLLAVTFTNKSAGEMRERVEKLLGPAADGLWVTTFHSACVRILRRDIGHLGLSRGFVIYDEEDALGVSPARVRRPPLQPDAGVCPGARMRAVMAALSHPQFHVVGLGGHAVCVPRADPSVARLHLVREGVPWR